MDGNVWDALRSVSEQGDVYKQRPSVGKRVKIVKGRKHNGKVGVVKWHGPDKFDPPYYMNDAQICLRDMIGRCGYRIKVEADNGESFFVSADYAEVLEA